MNKYPISSIDIIIQNSKREILLGKVAPKWQDGGKYLWGLPGREIAFGENLIKSVRRNLYEELGLRLKSAKVICVNSNFGFGNHYVAIGVIVQTTGQLVNKKTQDWSKWQWFAVDKIPNHLFPSAKNTLQSFIKNKTSIDF